MKALFYFPINVDTSPNSGIVKKNQHIASAFRSEGVEVDTITFSTRGIYLNAERIAKIGRTKIVRGIYNYWLAYYIVGNKVKFVDYDFVWIRAGLSFPPLVALLKKIRDRNPRAAIVLEYGAYPFKQEYVGYRRLLFYLGELFSGQLRKYASFVVTYCGQDAIYGIPTIKVGNGIDIREVRWTPTHAPVQGALHIISVSSLLAWHALDRVIDGLAAYYKRSENRREVVFHIVGTGPELDKLQERASRAGLERRVVFHGFKIKEDLDQVFEQSHLAIGSLGFHRIELFANSSMKNREYFARGFPFALAMKDADFPEDLPFVKYLPSDESPVDIESLIDFYEGIVEQFPDYATRIRKYAEEHLTWESRARHVLEVVTRGRKIA